jgi:hypothetical protein
MKYNLEYLNLHYVLIDCFMFNFNIDIFEVKYALLDDNLIIKITLLENCFFSNAELGLIKNKLNSYNVSFIIVNSNESGVLEQPESNELSYRVLLTKERIW